MGTLRLTYLHLRAAPAAGSRRRGRSPRLAPHSQAALSGEATLTPQVPRHVGDASGSVGSDSGGLVLIGPAWSSRPSRRPRSIPRGSPDCRSRLRRAGGRDQTRDRSSLSAGRRIAGGIGARTGQSSSSLSLQDQHECQVDDGFRPSRWRRPGPQQVRPGRETAGVLEPAGEGPKALPAGGRLTEPSMVGPGRLDPRWRCWVPEAEPHGERRRR